MTEAQPSIVAAFDLDGTLTEGGSVFKWLSHVGGLSRTWGAALRRTVPLGWGILRSGDAADRAKESLFHGVLRGRARSEVAASSHDFAMAHLERAGRPAYIERARWHVSQGHHVVVVSASPELYVEVIAKELGADTCISTRLAVDPLGRLTGSYLGRNCRGEEKQRRLAEWITAQPWGESADVYAYGNSRGDRRMLQAADHGYDAGKLGPFGALRKFERLSTP